MEKKPERTITFLDGAMGTMLQKQGLQTGEKPELLCFTHEDLIEQIHRQYLAAGSQIIYTNTFGANARKLEGSGYGVSQVVCKAVQIARRACAGTGARVALDVGPIGELLEPVGTLTFDEAYSLFEEIVTAGERAGADLVVFETMADLYEVKAAVLAAKERTKLPIFVTMTFEENGRTFTGCCVESMACTLEGLGVDAVGINCSLGPKEIFPLAQRLRCNTSLPMIIKANAGMPSPEDASYDISPREFAEYMREYGKLGVAFLGGCCGTTPEYIAELVRALSGVVCEAHTAPLCSMVCTPSCAVAINEVRVIGERLNPTGRKQMQQALLNQNYPYILNLALKQAEAGADILDLNVGFPGVDEAALMPELVKRIQSVVTTPLQLDSSNPEALEAGLRVYNGKAIVNSVNGEQKVLDTILPLVKKYGAAVIGLTLDQSGIPQTAEERFQIAERILHEARRYGIPSRDVLIDCLTLTVSAQQDQARETLKAVRMVRERLGLHTVLGVSNISFGLPNRELITGSFLTQALEEGLDLPIINPNQSAVMDAIAAFKVLHGEDQNSVRYIERFAQISGKPDRTQEKPAHVVDLPEAIEKGLREEARVLTRACLKDRDELAVIQELLIPALDRVGDRYEKNEIFLPQLMNAAAAACEAFDVIKQRISAKGMPEISKGKIIMATVWGDIHDIGKNIVRTVLENYGYQVIDLGKNVPPLTVVETAQREQVPLVGLSALMTTTLESMRQTIEALRNSGHNCKIMVGGAVLTPEYAQKIGADYYAKDAKQAVDIAKLVFGQENA